MAHPFADYLFLAGLFLPPVVILGGLLYALTGRVMHARGSQLKHEEMRPEHAIEVRAH